MAEEFLRTVAGDPEGWQRWAPREEIAPRFFFEAAADRKGSSALGLAGQGHDAVYGRWQKPFPVTGGRWYGFRAEYQAGSVPEPARSVLARVVWLDGSGRGMGHGDWPAAGAQPSADGLVPVTGVYPAPDPARTARVEVHLRWAGEGRVLWRNVEFRQVPQTPPRKVRLAAVNHCPRDTKSVAENLQQFGQLLDEAASLKPDIVCLPEGITLSGNGKAYIEVAETVPGPTTEFLGKHAARHRLYVVAGVIEKEGPAAYNTGVLIGRDGRLAGKYRKTCLPCEEIEGGVTPGAGYPVFDTDFGRVGIMICWDSSYPQVAQGLLRAGAEVILMPIAGGNDTLVPARAIENQVHIVTSGYHFKTAIFDQAGKTIALASKDPEVIVAEVDLSRPMVWPWLGDWRARIGHEGPTTKED